MSRELLCPGPDDKAGLKIDYLAKRLGQALTPQGFKRKARKLLREVGEGPDRHWQIINLQSGEHNAGAMGEFYVNLAVQFPAIQRVEAARPGHAWLQDLLDKVGEEHGQLRERLQSLLPEGHRLAGSEIRVGVGEDLPALADALIDATQQQALPWFDRHAGVAAVRDFDGSLLVADVDVRIAAALALHDQAAAKRLLEKHQPRWASVQPSYVEALRQWLQPLGVDCSALPAPGAPPKQDRWTLRREQEAAADEARQAAHAAQLMSGLDADSPDPARLAEAWLAQWQARWRDDPKPLVDLSVGVRLAAWDASGREAVLLALLQGLAAREAQARRDPIHHSPEEFEPDHAVAVLLASLIPTLDAPRRVSELFDLLAALQTRLQTDTITAHYPWGFAKLALWLTKQPHSDAQGGVIRQGMLAWLHGLSVLMPARFQAVEQALDARYRRPLNPNVFDHAAQLEEQIAYQAEVVKRNTPATLARLGAYPEQSLATDDKAAVRAMRRWLRCDPVTGRLPVHCEADDWGGPTLAAWQQLPPALRAALEPLLQSWMDAGVDAKPRVLAALRLQVAALPADLRAPWQHWVMDRLRAYEHHSGRTEWATTRMRRGVGAVLGEDSESLLLGLMLWSWADPGLSDDAVAIVWRSLAEAAWQRIPEHGARSPGVGKLGLRLLAGLGGTAHDVVQAFAADKAQKPRAKATAQALAEPLPRR